MLFRHHGLLIYAKAKASKAKAKSSRPRSNLPKKFGIKVKAPFFLTITTDSNKLNTVKTRLQLTTQVLSITI